MMSIALLLSRSLSPLTLSGVIESTVSTDTKLQYQFQLESESVFTHIRAERYHLMLHKQKEKYEIHMYSHCLKITH